MDLKLPGYEREVVDGLARARPRRALARLHHVHGEPRPAAASSRPGLRRGWSVPRVRRNYLRSPLYVACPRYAIALAMRARLPRQAAGRIAAGGCEAIMCHQML